MAVQSISGNAAVNASRVEQSGFDYNRIAGVRGNPNVTPEFLRGVEAMAERLGTRPEFLLAVMSFETGGTFDTGVLNAAGSGATGLIQFMPATAAELGTSTEALARMSPVEQLEYVERYFNNRSDPGDLGTLEGVYTTVLHGSPRPDPDSVLFDSGAAYSMNAGLDLNGDGRITSGEATAKVRERIDGPLDNSAPPPASTGTRPAPNGADAGSTARAAAAHTVVRGDTLWDIAMANGVSLQSLIEANPQIRNPDLIYPDQVVHLPGGTAGAAPSGDTVPASTGDTALDAAGPAANDDGEPATLRPYTVYSTGHQGAIALDSAADQQPHHDYQTVTREGQQLEVRDLVLHRDGESQTRQPLPSPIAGEVIQAGPNGGAGNAVMIRGENGQIVALFHLSSIDVKVGQQVGYGDVLGNQGSTGNSTGPHVHIEAAPEVIDRWVNDLLDGTYDGRAG
ncbi:peptidoglycan DD-metalloendopeptidase family protein [Lysobacter sp. GX 14042]|uniref:peptidoglycan DD-metalloendopeptidase family protein n=1 Tax=Lysobacter sp. GX 14042 TaxID=2907155 RepID=UPI001F2E7524|nr:peptidoglycan DD-metalloendopeptidase family protein [Lysobacter sp. GX 14042]MCE7031705.1 peptidoglycan DD-metalloendopeptidase family protein [Lysobacter sp. GX 14042]